MSQPKKLRMSDFKHISWYHVNILVSLFVVELVEGFFITAGGIGYKVETPSETAHIFILRSFDRNDALSQYEIPADPIYENTWACSQYDQFIKKSQATDNNVDILDLS